MKIKYFSLIIAVVILFFSACEQNGKIGAKPLSVNLHSEYLGIVSPPRNGKLTHLIIYTTDTEKKIVLDVNELSQNRIIMLPKGQYEFSADGIQSKVLDLQDDSKIIIENKTFSQIQMSPPPAISFQRGQRWNILSPLTADSFYYLTILDIDNLNIPINPYSATISGIGVIPLKTDKENNRIISKNRYTFDEGNITVSVSVNGVLFKEEVFRVEPLVIPRLTINNVWNKIPLQYATIIAYKTTENVPRGLMPRRDDGTGSRSFEAFDYANSSNVMKLNEDRFLKTGDNGKLEFLRIKHDEQIVLIAMGVNATDDVYTYTFNADYNNQTRAVDWTNSIPSKGNNFTIEIPVDINSLDRWEKINNFSASFYYQLGEPATIPSQDVLSDDGFIEITNVSYRRETDESILCFVDLAGIAKVSHFNFLIRIIDETMRTFVMNNTSDEIGMPEPIRTQEY